MKQVDLEGNRALINALKKAGFKLLNPIGEWNGYGYEKLRLHVVLKSEDDEKKFEELKKIADEKRAKQPKIDKKQAWIKRLSRLTGISLEEAAKIAEAKLEYLNKQIEKLDERQVEHFSVKREVLINKLERSNPLRRIRNKEHAEAILIAHRRHTDTNYDSYLNHYRAEAKLGMIDYECVRDYARIDAAKELENKKKEVEKK